MKEINGLFVEVGNYPDSIKDDINLPECGLGFLPRVISYGNSCYQKSYANKTYAPNVKHKYSIPGQVLSRIYQGRTAMMGEAPWVIRLELTTRRRSEQRYKTAGENKTTCTGVLVTFEWVLTAANCIEKGYVISFS